MDADKKNWISLLILTALTGLFFYHAFESNKLFFYLDHGFQNVPFRYYAFSKIRNGQMPLWCPFSAAGFPLFAEGQSGSSYLPVWPFFTLLSFPRAYNISLVFHVLWMSIGFYVLFRRYGYVSAAALSGAVCCTFSGYIIRKLMFVNYIQALSWVPWLLAVITFQKSYEKVNLVKTAALDIVILALICFAGHPQVIVLAVALLWLYGLFGLASISYRQKIVLLMIITLAGFIMGAWQLLPTAELMFQSSRSVDQAPGMFLAQMPLPPAYIPNLALNDPFGNAAVGTFDITRWPAYEWELNIFIGLTALALALSASWKSRQTRFFGICVITGLFLSLGPYSLSSDILSLLPFSNLLRAPARWAFMMIVGFSGLLAHTVNELTSENKKETCRRFFTRSLPGLLIFLVAGWMFLRCNYVWNANLQLQNAWLGALVFLLLTTVLITVIRVVKYKQAAYLVPLLVFAELFWANSAYPSTGDKSLLFGEPEGMASITDRHSRIMSLYHSSSLFISEDWHGGWIKEGHGDYGKLKDVFPMYSGLIHNLKLLTFDEWSPLHYSDYTVWVQNAGQLEHHIKKYFNIRYVCSPVTGRLFRGKTLSAKDNWVVDEIPESERGKAVDFRVPVGTDEDDISILKLIANRTLSSPEVLIKGFDDPAHYDSGQLDGAISVDHQTEHKKEITVQMNAPGCLVISEAFDPGWKAFIDNEPTRVLRGDLLFQTLLLPAGSHRLKLVYEPVSYRLGLFLSLLALLFLAFILSGKYRLNYYLEESTSEDQPVLNGLYLWSAIVVILLVAGYFLHNTVWNDSLSNWFL